jgi:hypothetical protein
LILRIWYHPFKHAGGETMRMVGIAILSLSTAIASAAVTVRDTIREDSAFKRWVTTCTHGTRSTTPWHQALQRRDTEIVTPPKPPQLSPGSLDQEHATMGQDPTL